MASWHFWTLIAAAGVLLIQRELHSRATLQEFIEVKILLQDFLTGQKGASADTSFVRSELQGIRSAIDWYVNRLRGG